jgi:hypothetical protein
MKFTTARAVGIALLIGVIAGLATPKGSKAVNYSVYIELWPGGSSDLTCGWHSGPCYDDDSQVASGAALDWASTSTISFYVKSLTDSPSFAVAGTGYLTSYTQATCDHRMYASVYDNAATWRAGVWYLHTDDSLTSFGQDINTQQYNLVSTSKAIGTTANETGCGSSWTGYHVHQMSDGGWTLWNYPDHSTCNKDYPEPFTNDVSDCGVSNSYYMGYANWSVAYP